MRASLAHMLLIARPPAHHQPSPAQTEGKIKAAVERASLAGVLAALAAAPGRGPSVARLAGQAVDFICAYYPGELSEDVKGALAGALGAWLPRCAGVPQPALARITGAPPPPPGGRLAARAALAGPCVSNTSHPTPNFPSNNPLCSLPLFPSSAEALKEKEALRRAHLRALAAGLRLNPEARGQAAALAAPLGKLVLEGCSKAAGGWAGGQAFEPGGRCLLLVMWSTAPLGVRAPPCPAAPLCTPPHTHTPHLQPALMACWRSPQPPTWHRQT